VEYPDGSSVTFTYDPVGNRLSAGETNYTYDSANRIIQMNGTPYEYDANGNLLSVGESVYYEYDFEDRLISFNDGTDIYKYSYDGDGNRLTQTVSGSVYDEQYSYIYDINAGLPRLLVEKDSQGNTKNYLYAGDLYGRIGPAGRLFYHADGLGSVSVVSGVYGEVLNRYTYDPFGNPLTVNETVDNPFRFTGEPYDPSGLIFLRARHYDPSTGRFLTPDTLMGQLDDPLSQNLYLYCGNNPVVYVDPSGHVKICTANSGDEYNYTWGELWRDLKSIFSVNSGWSAKGDALLNMVSFDDAVVITSFGSGFIRGKGNPAHNAAQYQKLKEQLALKEIQSVVNTTKHGAKRLIERGFTPKNISDLKLRPDIIKTQADGAQVFIKQVNGKYNVIVEGYNGVITSLKNISEKSLNRLSNNYGWR